MKKCIFSFILGALLFGAISGVIAYQITVDQIGFEPDDPNWQVSNLGEALNDLYALSDGEILFIGAGWKTAHNEDNDGLHNNVLINSNYVTFSNTSGTNPMITITKDCTLKIKGFMQNAGSLDYAPHYKLYKNDTLLEDLTNTKTIEAVNTYTMTVTAEAGDIFYVKHYGGGNRPFYSITIVELMSEEED